LNWKKWTITYLADTVNHVADKSVHSLDLALELVATEPHAESNDVGQLAGLSILLGHASHINVQVTQVLGNFAAWTGNHNNSSLNANGNCRQ
jgi:hypothetical protein